MSGWNSLPQELRQIIVEYIGQTIDIRTPHATTTVPQSLPLPLVCQEWQGYFSHVNFRAVFLDQGRLDDFRSFVSDKEPRRQHVRLIILRIKLPEYDCTNCQTSEDSATSRGNDSILRDTLEKFMGIMSDWTMNRPRSSCGIELDLGVYSPSDGRHGFRDSESKSNTSRTCPGWKRMRRGHTPLIGQRRRLAATLGDPNAHHFAAIWSRSRLAAAPILNRLTIRRQFYRHISSEILRRLVTQGLPNLVSFRHETWPYPDRLTHQHRQQEYLTVIQSLPLTVRSVGLFCDSNTILRLRSSPEDSRSIDRELGRALAVAATRLGTLSASFFVEAMCFLVRSSSGNLRYPRLKNLVLTSRTLSRAELSADSLPALSLVLAAATTAHRYMPKLRFLDVWYAENGDAFLVRFVRGLKPGNLIVCWYSTWHDDDDNLGQLFGVLGRIWRAQEPQPRRNRLVIGRAPFTAITGDEWHAMRYEELAICILHPDSMREIQEECAFRHHEEA